MFSTLRPTGWWSLERLSSLLFYLGIVSGVGMMKLGSQEVTTFHPSASGASGVQPGAHNCDSYAYVSGCKALALFTFVGE